MANPLLFDGTWLQQGKYEDAEAFYQKVVAGTSGTPSKSVQPSSLKSEIAQARQNITKALNEDSTSAGSSAAVDDKVIQRIKNLELENNNLKKSSKDLEALVKKLEARVAALETGSGGAPKSGKPAQPAASKPAKDDDDDLDSDFDPFASDDEDEGDKEYSESTKAALEAYHAKKAKKPALIAKSSLLLDVKPWDDETDMKEMEKLVRGIEMDGLVWGQAKLIPVGYGIKKLQINAVIEDDKVSTDDLEEKIVAYEDFVQSMDIAAFNKI